MLQDTALLPSFSFSLFSVDLTATVGCSSSDAAENLTDFLELRLRLLRELLESSLSSSTELLRLLPRAAGFTDGSSLDVERLARDRD